MGSGEESWEASEFQSPLPSSGVCVSAVRRDSRRPVWCWPDKSTINCSVNTGLARHSAITKGSLPALARFSPVLSAPAATSTLPSDSNVCRMHFACDVEAAGSHPGPSLTPRKVV